MRRKTDAKGLLALGFVFLILASMLLIAKPVDAQAALPTITIQANGTVNPSTAEIHRSGDTYSLTGNIYGAINILKSNIILDGAGYTLRGSFDGNSTDIWIVGTGPDPSMAYYTIGVDLDGKDVEGVTVKNLNVENFSIGMYIWTKNNTVDGNALSGCIVGLLMSGSNSTITKNTLTGNIEGLFFGVNSPTGQFPPDMVVYQNAFLRNNIQISGCQCKGYNMSETPDDWDNGKIGNYWSDYNGSDLNKDGIGATPYVIDVLDFDRFPLMINPVSPPVPPARVFVPAEAVVLVVSATVLISAAVLAFKVRKGRNVGENKNLKGSSS